MDKRKTLTADLIAANWFKTLTAIVTGEADDFLDAIGDAAWDRRKVLRSMKAAKMMSALSVGDIVSVRKNASLRPKYILGKAAEIIDMKKTRIGIRFLEPIGKYGTGVVTVPANCLELAPATETTVEEIPFDGPERDTSMMA